MFLFHFDTGFNLCISYIFFRHPKFGDSDVQFAQFSEELMSLK